MGFGGLESRARCAGFSMAEIGNHKERLRDYASFPDRQPNVTPNREAIQEAESESEAFLIPLTQH